MYFARTENAVVETAMGGTVATTVVAGRERADLFHQRPREKE